MIEEGAVAVIHFVGRLASDDAGAVFDTSDVDVALEEGIYHNHRDYVPLEIQIGDESTFPEIEAAVQTMDEGETKTVRLDPEEAFGTHHEDRIVEIPRADLEAQSETTATEGDLVGSDPTDGIDGACTGWITNVTPDTVEIDFNHELAGESVEFEIRLLNVYDN